ncbi:MAG: FMN-binding protein [Lentisphaeria bacterium]|nr:FMN-binding protein [Lentisphaeria bacterium]
MKDMRKASNPFYLAFFLLVVCGVSTLVMAVTAVKTDAPIKIAQARETAESLKMILPPFDNDPAAEAIDIKSPDGQPVKLYTARNGGLVVGYAAEASASGFGGKVAGLVSFKPDGTIDTVIVKSGHSETPGIGTKVTDRSVKRTISDVVKGVKPDTSKLPPNAALDSYSGIKPGAEKWTKEKDGVHFVSGATYSSNAVCDLVWYAATAVRDYLAKQGQTESGEAAPVVQEQPADGNAPAAPAEKKEEN